MTVLEHTWQKWIVRVIAIVNASIWYVFAVKFDHPTGRYEFPLILGVWPRFFLLFGLGLWLASTNWGKRHRILTTVMLIPAIFASSPPSDQFGSDYYRLSVGLFNCWVIFRMFHPRLLWRDDK